jgi:hypothetical protein
MAKKSKRKAKKAKKKKTKKVQKRAPSGTRKLKRRKLEKKLDEGLLETFPGSDPVALTDPVRTIKED